MDLDNHNALQAGIEMQSHKAGKEESKDHWNKQYNQTRIKAFGMLWKDRSRLVRNAD